MDILGLHTSSAASPLRPVSTGQDINDEAQSVISQLQGVTSIWYCCLVSRRLFCPITGSGENNVPEMSFDQSRSSDDVSHTASNRLCQAEAQTSACFLTIVEISIT